MLTVSPDKTHQPETPESEGTRNHLSLMHIMSSREWSLKKRMLTMSHPIVSRIFCRCFSWMTSIFDCKRLNWRACMTRGEGKRREEEEEEEGQTMFPYIFPLVTSSLAVGKPSKVDRLLGPFFFATSLETATPPPPPPPVVGCGGRPSLGVPRYL
jgi:hypothetical protein